MRRKVRRRSGWLPLIVKSLNEDGASGSRRPRLSRTTRSSPSAWLHPRAVRHPTIVEHYIEGRELYVGVIGNQRLHVFPVWELLFTKMPDDWHIATEKVKHDTDYQERRRDSSWAGRRIWHPSLPRAFRRSTKRIYRTLELDGYARIDFRLSADGVPYFLEANPQPRDRRKPGIRRRRQARRHKIPGFAASDFDARHATGRGDGSAGR